MPPRRQSINVGNNNPLAKAAAAAPRASTSGGGASLAGAKPFSGSDLESLVKSLKEADDNEARIELVKSASGDKLFKCSQILEMLGTTPSVKTQMAIVTMLAPRTSDPGGANVIVDSFRFSDEKNQVSTMMKNRENILKAGKMPGGGGGAAAALAGGRGGRGRGAGAAAGRGGAGGRGGRGGAASASTATKPPPTYAAAPAYASKPPTAAPPAYASVKKEETEDSIIAKELENRRKAKEADEKARKAEEEAEKAKQEAKREAEKKSAEAAAAAKKLAEEKALADKAAAEKAAIKAAADRKAARAAANNQRAVGGGGIAGGGAGGMGNPLNKLAANKMGSNPLNKMPAKTMTPTPANPLAGGAINKPAQPKPVVQPPKNAMPFRSGSMAGNNSYGGSIKSGSSNPFAGASALVNKNKGTSVNLNFKAGKMDAWAEETAKQKENRETSFQLIARYKFLKKVPVFKDLADNVVARIAGTLEVEDFSPGEDVVTQGDKGDKFFVIESGNVDVIRTETDPPKVIKLATLPAGNYFGEMSLLNDAPRYATCRAVDDVRCLSLSMKDFELSVPKGLLDETASKRKEETDAKAREAAAETVKDVKEGSNNHKGGGGASGEATSANSGGAEKGGSSGDGGEVGEKVVKAPPKQLKYTDLLDMNNKKVFGDYDPAKLETYLLDGEFEMRFAMSRASFYELPKWKQSNMKRMLNLY